MGNAKEELKEVIAIIKTSLTTIWFWLPILYTAYFFIQLWMIIYVHPLTILILPLILSIYSLRLEKKRVEVAYGLNEIKVLKASHPISMRPITIKNRGNLEKKVNEYVSSLKEMKKKRKKE